MRSIHSRCAAALLFAASALSAANITPSLDTIPTGPAQAPGVWYTDRFAPSAFVNAGTVAGRDNVLRLGISSADQQGSRQPAYSGAFYNTQGRKYDVNAGPGSYFELALYVNPAWSDPANGFARTDMWATLWDSSDANSMFPIVGFTNFGSPGPRYRLFDDGWVDLATPIAYGDWVTFRMTFSGSSVDYVINGAPVYSDTTVNGSVLMANIMVQAYNFGGAFDPGNPFGNADMGVANNTAAFDYDSFWAGSPTAADAVPEPSSMLLVGAGLLAAFLFARGAPK